MKNYEELKNLMKNNDIEDFTKFLVDFVNCTGPENLPIKFFKFAQGDKETCEDYKKRILNAAQNSKDFGVE